MVFATLAFLGAFGADQGLLTYFADLSGPGLLYTIPPVLIMYIELGGYLRNTYVGKKLIR